MAEQELSKRTLDEETFDEGMAVLSDQALKVIVEDVEEDYDKYAKSAAVAELASRSARQIPQS